MQYPESSGPAEWMRTGLAAASGLLLLCVAIQLLGTWQWPQISDAVLMHYVVFLLRHGMQPYRQIVDLNMPGSYAMDWAAESLFGGAAGGWRAFDCLLRARAGAALPAAGRRAGSGLAGLFASGLFAVWHVRDGVAQAGQRDLILTVLILSGYAALFRSQHTSSLSWISVFGVCCGLAATVKPQAAVFWAAVLLSLLHPAPPSHSLRKVKWHPILASAGGLLLPIAAMCAWLVMHGALGAFLNTARRLMVYHAGMARHTVGFLLLHAVPWQFWPILLAALTMMAARRSWTGFPQQAALLGITGGVLSFVLQGKAYPYHRYPLLAFVLLLFTVELGEWTAQPQPRGLLPTAAQVCVSAAMGFSALWLAPDATARALRQNWRTTPSLDTLRADLSQLGGTALNRQVQCMDTMAGCITVLERMQIEQATGFLYDCYFFAAGQSAMQNELRAHFLAEITSRPPQIFVVTDQWCFQRDEQYSRLAQWPAFAGLLAKDYQVQLERNFGQPDKRLATWPFSYRLYVRRGAPTQASTARTRRE